MPDITEQELDLVIEKTRKLSNVGAAWRNVIEWKVWWGLVCAYREVREQLRLRLAEPIFAECQAANRALNEARNELAELVPLQQKTRDLNVKLCDELEEVRERLAEARAEIERLKTSSVGLAQRVPNGWGT